MPTKLRLIRDIHTDKSTTGMLEIDGEFACYTLENPWLDNVRRVSCIKEGTYEIKFRREGGWFNRAKEAFPELHNEVFGMLELQDVPGRDYILIHWGNYPADTQGCILLGETRSTDMVGKSRDAYSRVYPLIAEPLSCGRKVTIEIEESWGLA